MWVGGSLTTKLILLNGFSVMVHVLASTRNEPSHPVERTRVGLLVWPSPQSSLATGPCFVSPQDHDVMNRIQSHQTGTTTTKKAMECDKVSIPWWDVNPFSPGDKSVAHHDFQRSSPGEQLEVPHPPAGVDPDGQVYQAGIGTSPRPAEKKTRCPVQHLSL